MVVEAKSYLTAPIKWLRGEDPEYPYQAEHEGHKLLVRLNDFPEEEFYALIADGEEITNFDDWPDSWTRPSLSEKDYQDRLEASESTTGTRERTEGFSISLQAPDANLPGEILREKEAAALCEKVRADVYLEVKRELDNSSQTDIRVVTCWGNGMSLKQISEATGMPISTVNRHLKAWQKRVLKRIAVQHIVDTEPEHRVDTYEIQNAVKKFTRAA
jgi:DNA-binding transcriptional ArsR family regulator